MDKDAKAPDHDVILLQGKTEDGAGIRALRSRLGRVEATELRALKNGVPITGEVVSLVPRQESPLLFDVDVKYSSDDKTPGAKTHAGPARVASRSYRENWEATFSSEDLSPKRILN